MDIRCKRAYRGPADDGRLTPGYGARNDDPNHAVALQAFLREEFHG